MRLNKNQILDRMLKRPQQPPKEEPNFRGALSEADYNQAAWVEVGLARHPLVYGRITIYDTICSR